MLFKWIPARRPERRFFYSPFLCAVNESILVCLQTWMSVEPPGAGANGGVRAKIDSFPGSRRPHNWAALSLVPFFWQKRKELAHLLTIYYEVMKVSVCENMII